jgi:hypothetical protein
MVSVTMLVGNQTGFFNILSGDLQTGFVGTVLPQPLVARVTDNLLRPVAGVPVVWSINNGATLVNTVSVTNSQGEVRTDVRLGVLAGIYTTTVSSAGLPTLTFKSDAQLPPNPGLFANQPAGFVRFAEHNMSGLPTFPRSLGGLAGSWFVYPENDPDLVLITPDTAAPHSRPYVIRTRFPAGLSSGGAPVNMGGWDAASTSAGQKSKFYISLAVKINGTNYENQSAGTKMGFIAYGEPFSGGQNTGYFLLNGNGSTSIGSAFAIRFVQQGHVSRSLIQNVSRSPLMTVGSWHHWEAVFEINTLGQANGKLKMWIDGVQIMDYSDVVFANAANPQRFYAWKWNPTWGGIGGSKTRQDFISLDHVYLSGIP